MALFEDRRCAGRRLAEELDDYRDRDDVVVLALPRGGVPVAHEVARALRAPLDVIVVRKLGVLGHDELAMGAIASGGVRVLNDAIVDGLDGVGMWYRDFSQTSDQAVRALLAREPPSRVGRSP
jgi:putative phosphoribosyl transferase